MFSSSYWAQNRGMLQFCKGSELFVRPPRSHAIRFHATRSNSTTGIGSTTIPIGDSAQLYECTRLDGQQLHANPLRAGHILMACNHSTSEAI